MKVTLIRNQYCWSPDAAYVDGKLASVFDNLTLSGFGAVMELVRCMGAELEIKIREVKESERYPETLDEWFEFPSSGSLR